MKVKQKDFGIPGAGRLWVFFLLIGLSMSAKKPQFASSEVSEEQKKQEGAV